jgi:hypothetical protein
MANAALRQFNPRLLELARENSDATFDFLGAVVKARNIRTIEELWSTARPGSRQVRELTNQGRRVDKNADFVSQSASRIGCGK